VEGVWAPGQLMLIIIAFGIVVACGVPSRENQRLNFYKESEPDIPIISVIRKEDLARSIPFVLLGVPRAVFGS
jgi:hypothetical protein